MQKRNTFKTMHQHRTHGLRLTPTGISRHSAHVTKHYRLQQDSQCYCCLLDHQTITATN
jgi:hypothetical protein